VRDASLASSASGAGTAGGSASTPPTGSARESVDEPHAELVAKKDEKKKKRKSFL